MDDHECCLGDRCVVPHVWPLRRGVGISRAFNELILEDNNAPDDEHKVSCLGATSESESCLQK